MPTLTIDGRTIGHAQPCYVVAEISANHGHDLQRAMSIVRAAKAAGADAVKLQTYTPDTLTIDADTEWFRIPAGNTWAGSTLYALYQTASTPWEWHAPLQECARGEGLGFFSSAFDVSSVEFLSTLGVGAYKIASFELVDLPLLRAVGRAGKPVILSTGMATPEEISEAVAALREAGAVEVALLKCTSAYPARASEMNLRTIPDLASRFGVVAGLSDHTLGTTCAVGAVAVGASIIEKHLTLSRAEGGPDASFSMEPQEFTAMVNEIRELEAALGGVWYERTADEEKNLCFRRSLFVVTDMKRGQAFTLEDVRSIRPGYGLAPRFLDQIVGRMADRDIVRGTPLSWELVSGARES
jgi:pseudaminic acid synthase